MVARTNKIERNTAILVGSGLIATAFIPHMQHLQGTCLYAAGVSHSQCRDNNEFAREQNRLCQSLRDHHQAKCFVYFGTCSVLDSTLSKTPYVAHKIKMESLVKEHAHHPLIIRFPQIAGRTTNPHTILNYLYARISRSERFRVWEKARRNILDIDDAVALTKLALKSALPSPVNIACPQDYSVLEIVSVFEKITGKTAIYDLEKFGTGYSIDIPFVRKAMSENNISFDADYLETTLGKYYG